MVLINPILAWLMPLDHIFRMFRASETTPDNCSQVFLAVHMVEIDDVLLVEEIGVPTLYQPPNTFFLSQTPSQPTNNLSSQEFSMRHQKTSRFTCKFSEEAVKLKIIQGNLCIVTVKRMIKDKAAYEIEVKKGQIPSSLKNQ